LTLCCLSVCLSVRLHPGAVTIRRTHRLHVPSVGTGRRRLDVVRQWNRQLPALRHRPAALANVRRVAVHPADPADPHHPALRRYQTSQVRRRPTAGQHAVAAGRRRQCQAVAVRRGTGAASSRQRATIGRTRFHNSHRRGRICSGFRGDTPLPQSRRTGTIECFQNFGNLFVCTSATTTIINVCLPTVSPWFLPPTILEENHWE